MMKKILLSLVWIACCSLAFGQSPFGSKQSISTSTGSFPRVIDSDHLDNDAYVDIVIGTDFGGTIEWYKNNGNGTFTLQTLISSTLANVNGIEIADLNNDGDKDVIATSNSLGRLVWFENNGAGGFGSEQLIASGLTSANAVKAGDMDNNGTIDVVVSSYSMDGVYWYSNNGSGNFGSAQTVSGISNSGPLDIDLADHDLDNDLDVVVAYGKVDAIILFNNNYTQTGSVSFDTNVLATSNYGLRDVRFGDVNDDGDLEILKVDQYLNTAWYENSGSFTETVFTTSNNAPSTVLVSDLDQDSSNDVLVGYSSTASTDKLTWYKDSTTSGEEVIDETQNDIYDFTLNDFDNDGDLDMASISSSENHLNWFENTALSLSNSEFEIESISIYPNPAANQLNFKGPSQSEYKVSVYDMLGKKVISGKTIDSVNKSLNISQLNRGVYIIDFEGYNTSFKFIKK